MTLMRSALLVVLSVLLLAGCGSSVVDKPGTARGAGAATMVPADATLYVGVVTDLDSAGWKSVETLLARFPDGEQLLGTLAGAIGGEGTNWERDVKPALGPVTAIVSLPGSGEPVALTKPSLRASSTRSSGGADHRSRRCRSTTAGSLSRRSRRRSTRTGAHSAVRGSPTTTTSPKRSATYPRMRSGRSSSGPAASTTAVSG